MRRFAGLLAGLSLVLASAAGGEETAPGLDSSRVKELLAKSRAGEELSKEERAIVLQSLWEWPAGRGPARDLAADDSECRERIAADPEMKSAHPLQIFIHQVRCMEAVGWAQTKKKTAP